MTTHTTQEQDLRTALTLDALRDANIARQAEWCPDQVPDLSFRGNELAGETGEACNVIKKLERERQGWRGSRATLEDLAEELADVVICADLSAMTAGINLAAAVVSKFNATSDKVGISVRLAAPPRPVDAERVEPHFGWIYHNPDEGWEWSAHHPVESGEVDDATEIQAATGPVLKDMLLAAWDEAEEARAELDNVREFDWRQTPAHAPDKAVTREGRDAIADRMQRAFPDLSRLDAECAAEAAFPECLALAAKPTGTEAGRGVVEDWREKSAKQYEEIASLTEGRMRACAQAVAFGLRETDQIALWNHFQRLIDDNPTPPVSPFQINPIGNQKQGVEIILKKSEYDSEAFCYEEPFPGMVVVFDPDGSILEISIEDLSANMAPPVPGVSPSPDSTGQGDAQAQEGVSGEVEALARTIAAEKIGSADPTGARLPADIWEQAIPEAQFRLSISTPPQGDR